MEGSMSCPSRIAVVACFSLLSCSAARPSVTSEPVRTDSLFDRLGGRPAIEAVVDELFLRIAADESLNAPFAVSHVPRTRIRLIEMICAAAGGPCNYSGRDMKSAHHGMGVTQAQFNALAGHLSATLQKLKVPKREQDELFALIAPTQKDIVEVP
jgi:hemoglobin